MPESTRSQQVGGRAISASRIARNVAAIVGAGVVLGACASGPDVEASGPEDGEVVNAEALASLVIEARVVDGELEDPTTSTVTVDGETVTDGVEADASGVTYTPSELPDGDREVVVDLADGGTHTFAFVVAATPPELEVTAPTDGVLLVSDDLVVEGRTDAGADVTLDGDAVEVDADGAFAVPLDAAPDEPVTLAATDPNGNTTSEELDLIALPSRVPADEVRAVHVTPHAWATASLRDPVLEMIDDGRINSVQLDLKDEGGRIGYDSDVELAVETGAVEGVYDLDEAVAELHSRDVHIVGRIVAFRDPVLGQYAQDNDHLDWLIQTTDGEPYTAGYGCCFTSFAHPDVIEYNLAIAEEAAAAGVDAILWDYIRRPDGSPDNMIVPGLSDDADGATLEEAIVDFAAQADERLARYRVDHGASLYGIAADRPTQIAQDVPALAEHLDYVAPMIYPSHWGVGEYGVDDPNRQPYDIITATLEVWQEAVEGERARVVPWLEDTNYRAWDRPFQVREQIRATEDQGIDEWLMWDPVVRYTEESYEPRD